MYACAGSSRLPVGDEAEALPPSRTAPDPQARALAGRRVGGARAREGSFTRGELAQLFRFDERTACSTTTRREREEGEEGAARVRAAAAAARGRARAWTRGAHAAAGARVRRAARGRGAAGPPVSRVHERRARAYAEGDAETGRRAAAAAATTPPPTPPRATTSPRSRGRRGRRRRRRRRRGRRRTRGAGARRRRRRRRRWRRRRRRWRRRSPAADDGRPRLGARGASQGRAQRRRERLVEARGGALQGWLTPLRARCPGRACFVFSAESPAPPFFFASRVAATHGT